MVHNLTLSLNACRCCPFSSSSCSTASVWPLEDASNSLWSQQLESEAAADASIAFIVGGSIFLVTTLFFVVLKECGNKPAIRTQGVEILFV